MSLHRDSTEHADVVVVGAGPAGTTAARRLAAGGREVLLLDRAAPPRLKPCGGGLPPRALRELGLDPTPVIAGRVRSARLLGGWLGAHARAVEGMVVVDRPRFDAWLVEQARAQGVRFHAPRGVLGLTRLEEGQGEGGTAGHRAARWRVETTTGPVTAHAVIGADGFASMIARAIGFPPPRMLFCLERDVPVPASWGEAARHALWIHLALEPKGYAWAFPKGDRANLGIGGAWPGMHLGDGAASVATARRRHMEGLRARLDRFERLWRGAAPAGAAPSGGAVSGKDASHGEATAGPTHGGFLPVHEVLPWYGRDGVYLVGDAARLVDHLTGEGIVHAIHSGRLAAEAILGSGAHGEDYDAAIRAEILPEMALGVRAARRFQRTPVWLRALSLTLPGAGRLASAFADLLSGRIDYATLFRRLGRAVD